MTTITRENAASFKRPVNRPDPVGPAHAYKTYSIEAPVETHWVEVSCEEAGCLNHHNGFKTQVDVSTELGKRQAWYITQRSGREFTETQDGASMVTFTFPPGTECFAQHRAKSDRPPLLLVRNGDWRRYLGRPVVHDSPESWVDDFASHQDRLVRYLGR
jgi:hypothetical protein